MQLALRSGADGVGLYRTEFLYMKQRHLPTEEELCTLTTKRWWRPWRPGR